MIGRYALAYAAWLVGLALAAWAVTSLHGLALGLYVLLGLGPFGMAAYQNAVFLLLALAWLGWVVFGEHALRNAAAGPALGRGILRTVAPVAVLALGSFALLRALTAP